MDQAIHDRIRKSRVVQTLLPVLDGYSTGEDRCPGPDAVIEQFEQIVTLARSEGTDRKIVDDDQIDFGDGPETLADGAVGVTETEFLEQARGAPPAMSPNGMPKSPGSLPLGSSA